MLCLILFERSTLIQWRIRVCVAQGVPAITGYGKRSTLIVTRADSVQGVLATGGESSEYDWSLSLSVVWSRRE